MEWFWERAFLAEDTELHESWGENKPEIFNGSKRSVCSDRWVRGNMENMRWACAIAQMIRAGSFGGACIFIWIISVGTREFWEERWFVRNSLRIFPVTLYIVLGLWESLIRTSPSSRRKLWLLSKTSPDKFYTLQPRHQKRAAKTNNGFAPNFPLEMYALNVLLISKKCFLCNLFSVQSYI